MRLLGTKLAANSSHRGFGDQLYDLSGVRPSLDLNFSANKSLIDSASGQNLVTFTRASSGTYVGSDGLIKTATTDAPRFDHNPTTGESLGLLVEEQRTNLALNTVLAGGTTPTSWTLAGTGDVPTIVLSTFGNADGAVALSFTSTASRGYLTQTVALLANTTYAFSVLVDDTSGYASGQSNIISLNNGPAGSTITAATGSPTSKQRISTTIAVGATAGNVQLRIGLGVGSNATGTLILSRPQLEAGAFPTSYIPTTTATVTRSADVASITGASFSSWYRQDEGTVFAEAPGIYSTGSVVTFSDGSNSNRILLDHGTNTRRTRFISGGSEQAAFSPSYTYGTQLKTSFSYASNYFSMANAGVLASGAPDTTGLLPVGIDRIFIGSNSTGAGTYSNTSIRRLTYWPTRLSDTSLQQVTQ
jgi:hypothetical protein